MKKEEAAVIGIDIGYGFSKVVTSSQRIVFPSRIGPQRETTFRIGGEMAEVPGETVKVAAETYFVGKKAELCDMTFSLRTRDWVQSDIYSALVVSSLMRGVDSAGLSNGLSVITGLPVDYMRSSAKAEERIRIAANSLEIQLHSIKVIPQAFGTFFDYVLDMSGEPVVAGKIRLLGIVDVGYHTTDYVLIKDYKSNIERAAASITTGIFNIIDGVRRDLMNRFDRENVTNMEAEECIRRGKSIKIGGETIDVSGIVDAHSRNTAQTIIGEIKSRWALEGELDKVLLTGGGSILLKPYLKDISHASTLTEGAQIANARGYFKHGLFLQKALNLK